ncbi:MAG: putative rane protein, partial [Ramlibacter sp.]|nr:putative rane protein [Ramlibacter sp.]
GLLAIFGVTAWEIPDRPWQAPAALAPEAPKLGLSQESIEAQQEVFRRAIAQLAPQRPDVTDVYGLVFAPYASEDVFLRESTMVADLLAQRFDAKGRVLQLVNHPDTVERLAWATPLNLKRAIDAIGERMDREHDLLVIYMTSHGARDFQLAAANPPLEVDAISPGELRKALDEAGIRHRVIAISACFSGGWLGPLGGETTLVMTAADADHTSYGCGRLSDLTFFGRAMFDEQLRKTHSFEQAFAAAVPVIKQREIDAAKPDGFSNPQISVGEKIRPLLKSLEERLDRP